MFRDKAGRLSIPSPGAAKKAAAIVGTLGVILTGIGAAAWPDGKVLVMLGGTFIMVALLAGTASVRTLAGKLTRYNEAEGCYLRGRDELTAKMDQLRKKPDAENKGDANR
jgi:hypothetical protein